MYLWELAVLSLNKEIKKENFAVSELWSILKQWRITKESSLWQ